MRQLELLTVEQMYAADRAAIRGNLTAEILMERAGRAVSEQIQRRWQPKNTVILCGPGANGGDGWVVARQLAAAGWPIKVALVGDRARLKGETAHHAGHWAGSVEPATPDVFSGAELIVDALFGAGLNRELQGTEAEIVNAMDKHPAPVVAIDLPTGVNGNDGQVMGAAATADLTVTFFRKKPGHLLVPGRFLAGETVVADIGIPQEFAADSTTFENAPALWPNTPPELNPGGHKYSRGHVLVGGGLRTTGASRLAARSALRAGAGLVTIAAPTESWPIYAAAELEVMVHPLASSQDFSDLLQDSRFTTVILGPGLGVGERAQHLVKFAAMAKRKLVLDADALTAFTERPEDLFSLLDGNSSSILTPHAGEFRRIFPDIGGSKLNQARLAAARSKATVILKGPDTVVAAPDGRAVINSNAPPWLATAGSGDVLAGIVAGLLSAGSPPFEAAAAAVWLHGAAATALGGGMLASDLIKELPNAFADAANFQDR